MAIITQFQDADEYLHDTDMELVANQQLYGVVGGCAVTYDAADLTVDIAAGSILHNGSVVHVAAATDALTLVADASNERWSYITLDSSGSAVLVSGTAAADASTEPSKPELGDRVLLAMVKIEAAQTIANNISVKLDKRVPVRERLTLAIQSFVEDGFASLHLSGAIGDGTIATGEHIGLGFSTLITGTGTLGSSTYANLPGGIRFFVTASGDDAGLVSSGNHAAADDWVFGCRVVQGGSASGQQFFLGLSNTASDFDATTNQEVIGWRLADTGNYIGVCDSGGTETTRDSSNNDTSEHTLRVQISGGGTTVRFFFDNAQVGADVTTNIPSGTSLALICGLTGTDAADHNFYTSDIYAYRGN